MSEPVVVGDFVDGAAGPAALTGVELDLRALDFVAHWKRCGLTADWLAAYLAYDFEPATRGAAVNVLSTAINELLENAAKWCADKRGPVRVAVRHHGDFVRIETQNVADERRSRAFREALADLEGDLDALFARRIERQKEPGASGVGLVILKKDYGARIGARFAVRPDGHWDVHVQLSLDAEEVR